MEVLNFIQRETGSMSKDIKVLGIDLAKNVFQLHGTDAKGKRVLSKRLSRSKLISFMSNLKPCLVGIEACTGAHYWSRVFESYGHTVKMMAPQFVKPYILNNKNDVNDAKGISEAVTRPNMKFVPIKKIEQQDVLLMHRARDLIIKQRTAQANQIRGLLAEYGVVCAQGVSQIRRLPELLDDNRDKLTHKSIKIFTQLHEQFKSLDDQVSVYDKDIEEHVKSDTFCQELIKMEGIGPISASAVVATIGDASKFKNGREVSAWLGLVPRQNSSGNNIRLGGISKRGDKYIRTLLIHGARAVIRTCSNKTDRKSQWVNSLKERCGYNKAAVALANKNARTIWAIMLTGECYRVPESVAA